MSPRNKGWRSMPGAFSQYREDDSHDSDGSDTSVPSNKVPRGSDSPTKQSMLQQDEGLDTLSSQFGKSHHVHPLSQEDCDGEGRRIVKERSDIFPGVFNLFDRPPSANSPQHRTAAASPISSFSFAAGQEALSYDFNLSNIESRSPFPQSGLGKSSTDPIQSPETPFDSFGKFADPANSLFRPLDKSPFDGLRTSHLDENHSSLFGGQKASLFSGQYVHGFGKQTKDGFGSQKTPLFSDQTAPLFGGQYQASTDSNLQTKMSPGLLSEITSSANTSHGTQASSTKRQSEHLQAPEDSVNDEGAPTKRQFGQSRPVVEPMMPESYVPAPSAIVPVVKPTFSTLDDFITYARNCLSLNKTDMESVTANLKSLYNLIVAFTKGVASNTRTMQSMKEGLAVTDREFEALLNKQCLKLLPQTVASLAAQSDHRTQVTLVEQKKAAAQAALKANETSLRLMEDSLLERVIDSIQSVADQTWSTSRIPAGSQSKVEETNTRVNKMRLEMLALEKKLEKMECRATLTESAEDNSQHELDHLRNDHRATMAELRDDHRAELNNIRSKSARDQKDALDELKTKYVKQIQDADGKLRLHKQTMALNKELETTTRDLQREKYNLGLAKAAVKKELRDLKTQVTDLQSYKEGFTQVEKERDEFKTSYNDIKVERDDLLRASGIVPAAPKTQDLAINVPSLTHTHAGILKSYDEDLGVLEAYWNRQKHFAELAVRSTAAELVRMEAELTEITIQIRILQGLSEQDGEENDDEFSEGDDDAVDPDAERPANQLLDTLAQPLPARDSYPAPSSGSQVIAPALLQPQTWAGRAAAPPPSNQPRAGRAYVQVSYQGAGVSTVKRFGLLNRTAGSR